jgi:DNA-binding transcriptional LysR family regulator
VPLTQRAGRRLRLTFAGEILAGHARTILQAHDDAVREIAAADDPAAGTVRFGFLSPLGGWLVPQLLAAFSRDHPAVAFELRHDGASRIRQASPTAASTCCSAPTRGCPGRASSRC